MVWGLLKLLSLFGALFIMPKKSHTFDNPPCMSRVAQGSSAWVTFHPKPYLGAMGLSNYL